MIPSHSIPLGTLVKLDLIIYFQKLFINYLRIHNLQKLLYGDKNGQRNVEKEIWELKLGTMDKSRDEYNHF